MRESSARGAWTPSQILQNALRAAAFELTLLRFKPYTKKIVKRLFHLALLLSALFGFVAQGVVMAMAPGCEMAMPRMATTQSTKAMPMVGKMACCPKTHSGKAGSKPAKNLMQNCPMMAGGFVSLAFVDTPALPAMIATSAQITDWPLAMQLANRATAPEPPPPTL